MTRPLRIFLPFIIVAAIPGRAQELRLQEVYALARENYPLAKQRALVDKTNEYTLDNASKAYLPQIVINGQATYQSTVTAIPIRLPGIEIPSLSKDQYKIYAELNQPLYDGGFTRQYKQTLESKAMVEQQKLEVELYKLKERINQLFFGALLINEQLKQMDLIKKYLHSAIHKIEAAVANGVAFKSNADVVKAEILRADQRVTELNASKNAYLQMLGLFINKPLDNRAILVKPESPPVSASVSRPELTLIEQQAKSVVLQREMLDARNRPKINLFVQAGYGRPALNMLSNTFQSYYIGGLRMSWPLTGLYTIKKDRALVDLSGKGLDLQKEIFLFNTNLSVTQQDAEEVKFRSLLKSDEEIITLRASIKNAADAQLKNGVISTSDFLRELNAEMQARDMKSMHEIQLLMSQYNRQTITGK
jgi:outer membrane protein TolC